MLCAGGQTITLSFAGVGQKVLHVACLGLQELHCKNGICWRYCQCTDSPTLMASPKNIVAGLPGSHAPAKRRACCDLGR